MKHMKKQDGITLIELLTTITILSIVSVIIYSVISNGLHYSSKAENKVLIQQEANYLLTILKEQHETRNSYWVTVSNNYTKVFIKNSNGKTFTIENPNYRYKIYRYDPYNPDDQPVLFENNQENTINNSEKYFPIIILIESNIDTSEPYEIKTILSRL